MRLPRPVRYALVLGLLLSAPSFVLGQNRLTWNFTYDDLTAGPGATSNNFGFADQVSGQARIDTVTAVTNYMSTILDARGTINLEWQPSVNDPSGGTLASAGTSFTWPSGTSPTLVVGNVYRQASGNIDGTGAPPGIGTVNFGRNWFATGLGGTGTPGSGQFDLYTVVLHELTHALHFTSVFNADGTSQFPGNVYTRFDGFVYRGATGNNRLLNSTNNGFAGSASDLTSNDLYWGGTYGVAANGGNRIKLYAPNPFAAGTNVSHLDQGTYPNLLMSPTVVPGQAIRQYSGIEIGMLLDLGWNNFEWNGTTGSWSAGANVAAGVSASKWRNSAITNNSNTQVFAPVGEVTYNLVLTFGGSGSTAYTATNDLPANPFKLNRLNLNSTATVANTIAGNDLAMSNDNGFDVTPRIEQQSTGAFAVANNVAIPKGLEVGGPGSGQVSLTGVLSGAGRLVKQDSFTLALGGNNTYSGGTTISGGVLQLGTGGTGGAIVGDVTNNGVLAFNRSNAYTFAGVISGSGSVVKNGTGTLVLTAANTYTGGTSVNAGTLLVNGRTGPGTVTVAGGATLGGTGRIGDGTGGALSVQSGGTVFPGDGASVGTLTLDSSQSATFAGGSTLRVAVGSSPAVGSQFRTTAGNIDLSGLSTGNRLNITLTGVGPLQTGSLYNLTVFDAGGVIVYPGGFDPHLFNVTAVNFAADGTGFQLAGDTHTLTLAFTPVPEPGAVLAAGAIGLGLAGLARRRRAAAGTPLAV
jgi:fibronectin-binding autotransporter adhesin